MRRAVRTSRDYFVAGAAVALFATALASCFEPAYRDIPEGASPPFCTAGKVACLQGKLSVCSSDGSAFDVTDDCGAKSQVCSNALLRCVPCDPGSGRCIGQVPGVCRSDGAGYDDSAACDPTLGFACRNGACRNLCEDARLESSNVGCEYWAVDLDNAVVNAQGNAAAQQFAVVVSNAQADVPTQVVIDVDDAEPGQPPKLRTAGKATVTPNNLEVFKLGPREVDGSPDGFFNTGSGTALSRHAFRIRSSMPIVAYQFNPLENVNVFSNDASQLLPTAAIGGTSQYVVAGWPQTIATSSIPSQNFGTDLRGFLAIVGTKTATHVTIATKARILSGGPLAQGAEKGDQIQVTLDPFDVLNLETNEFNGDFTGSVVTADGPVMVFPGSEASDAPFFNALSERLCCADHLEEQLPPVRAVGKSYVLAHMPNRTKAIAFAGGKLSIASEPEFFRVVTVTAGTTHVKTSLPAPDDEFDLVGVGSDRTLVSRGDFELVASEPAIVLDVQASQEAAGVARGLPGGDPSTTYVPPVEQYRSDYVLLTPDKYAFEFLVLSVPYGTSVFLDGLPLDASRCDIGAADGKTDQERGGKKPANLAYRCQLSFPVVFPDKTPPDNVQPGKQSDGVHRLQSDHPIGVIVYGFDSFVSYAYAGGTELKELFVP
ncbi:hypothetical protein BH09MYX1_BH09MYX1_55590 [soil metagenome]